MSLCESYVDQDIHDYSNVGRFGHGRFGHGRFGHGRFGQGRFGHGRFGHGHAPLNVLAIENSIIV